MGKPDWNEVEQRLYKESVSAIEHFSKEHTDEEVCYFAYDSQPEYGYVLICFDTSKNSLEEAKRVALRSVSSVKGFMSSHWDWQMAKSMMISVSVLPFTNNTADFKYHSFSEVQFEGWYEFTESEDYPLGEFEEADDYLEGNMAWYFGR